MTLKGTGISMFVTRIRQSVIAAVVVLSTVGGATGFLGSNPASAATPDGGTSNAYGINVTALGGNILGPIPSVTLGADGQESTLSQTLPVDVPGLITANTLNALAVSTNFGQANEDIAAFAGTEGLTGLPGVSLLGPKNPLLDVQAVNVSCNSDSSGSLGGTQIVGLSIDGANDLDIPSDPPPNTGLTASELGPLAGLVTITLNKQVVLNRGQLYQGSPLNGTNIDVIGLQITLLSGIDSGVVINVSHTFCEATGADIESVPTITSMTPHVGPVAGGTTVTITGTGFTSGSDVDFGTQAAASATYVSPTEMTAVSPPALVKTANSTVAVSVSDQYGFSSSTVTPANSFTYEVTPSLLTITPTSGPTTGGQAVLLTGSNFGPDTAVYFGSGPTTAQATDVVVGAAGKTLTAVTPAHAAGPVNVTVADVGGVSTLTNGYTYITAPIEVTSVVPDVGPTAGGTAVVITGQGFTGTTGAAGVTFGGNNATTYKVVSDTTIDATSPAGAAGTVNVIVTNTSLHESPPSLDSSFPVVQDEFTYEAAPTIATTNGLVPNTGPTAGGTDVTITGTNFGPDSTVAFGANAGTSVDVVSSTTITVTSPASTLSGNGGGPVSVKVTDAGGTSNGQTFTYIPPPVINTNGIVPDFGPTAGGTNVTITGSNFVTTGVTSVTFAGAQATNVVVVNSTTITATSPAGLAGPANVVVTDAYGSSGPQTFTYLAPPLVGVNGLDPAYGPTTGGTLVVVSGSNLEGASSVIFNATTCTASGATGGTPATIESGGTASAFTISTPASPLPGNGAGPVTVCVTAAGGTALSAQDFTYESVPPVINPNGLNPTQGPVGGGTKVTITGSGFGPGDPNTTVTFGGAEGAMVDVVSTTEITVVTPPSPLPGGPAGSVPGPVPVVVADSGGSATAAQQFTYVVVPVVTGISPTSGPEAGGEMVYIMGTGLQGASAVDFGKTGATITSDSATEVVVTEPPGTGTVPVTVTTPGGIATSPEDFTYISPGYWEAASDGGVFSFGGARFFGSVPGVLQPGQKLNEPIVAMADTPDHGGYWLFAADGGVFSFGDAQFYGSIPGVLQPGQTLNGPVVAAEATPDGKGYRMFCADGGVFDFGDAAYEGGLPGSHITPSSAVAGAVAYPFAQASPNPAKDTAGYWLVTQTGAVYTFGNAPAEGGANFTLSKVVAMATTPDGNGYFMFLQNGQVGHFGDAPSEGGNLSSSPIVFGQATSTGGGYWEFAANGAVSTYGDAPFEQDPQTLGYGPLNAPITAAIAFGANSTSG
jgi:hypothetical protein